MNTRIPPGPGGLPMPSRRLFVQGLAAGGVVAGA
ncbi:TPA: twin-arginine translocation signal domain-containing protein, partial [Stenotrophomonas maltophilia]|nr:twin-arginine translocation signal domain-containing protein [Stenotrophomonas maltophilia]